MAFKKATTETALEMQSSTNVTTIMGPSGALRDRGKQYAGKGVSTAQEDNILPMIYTLQSNSPQVNSRNPAYIDGASPGCIWLRSSNTPIVNGEVGVPFIPCYFTKEVVEWIARDQGGGFVARHPCKIVGKNAAGEALYEPVEETMKRVGASAQPDERNAKRTAWRNRDGHEFIETRYHAGLVLIEGLAPMPYVIPFSGTGHTVSRDWTYRINSMVQGHNLPAWATVWNLKTQFKTNAAGEWFLLQPDVAKSTPYSDEHGYLNEANLHLLEVGNGLNEALSAGLKTFEAPEMTDGGGATEETRV